MNPRVLLIVAAVACVACSGGSGGPDGVALGGPVFQLPDRFGPVVDHPFHPLREGSVRVYMGIFDGIARRDEVRVLPGTVSILGVACTAVLQEVYLDGALAEMSTEWFAQDEEGNVWRFGEESLVFEDGSFEKTADSWIAGAGDARPWIVLGAAPQIGDLYVGYTPNGEEKYAIVSLTAEAIVPAGLFQNCVQANENPDDPNDSDVILYAANVGLVSEENIDGRIELVEVR